MEQVFGNEFKIFQDNDSIAIGKNWKRQIEESLDEAIFFIPVITPSFFTSNYCRDELQRFLERENKLHRDDLIFPIYYMSSPLLEDDAQQEADEIAQAVSIHQRVDWRELRFEAFNAPQTGRALANLASDICNVLNDMIDALGLEVADVPVETSRRPSAKNVRILQPRDPSPRRQEQSFEDVATDASLRLFKKEERLITVDQRMIDAHSQVIILRMEEGQEAANEERYDEAAELFKEAVDYSLQALKALRRGRRKQSIEDADLGELKGA